MRHGGLLALCLALLPACSVGMAASGNKPQDTTVIFPGSNRAVIMSKLGPPDLTRTLEDGKTEDTYLVKEGNEASSGRAWAHAGLDLLSLGMVRERQAVLQGRAEKKAGV